MCVPKKFKCVQKVFQSLPNVFKCTLYLAVVEDCTELYGTGSDRAVLDFTGLHWAVLGCTGLYWTLLGWNGLNWVDLGFFWGPKMKAGQNVSGQDTIVVTKFLRAENSWDKMYPGQNVPGIKWLTNRSRSLTNGCGRETFSRHSHNIADRNGMQ